MSRRRIRREKSFILSLQPFFEMDATPLIASFILFASMELGDKTQLAVIALSMRERSVEVFIGALLAFALVDGVSVAFGGVLSSLLPTFWIKVGSGVLFLLFGALSLLEGEEEQKVRADLRNVVLSSFSLVTLMELGDKTQFAAILLSARYGAPLLVFLGILLASAVLTGGGVIAGRGLMAAVPSHYIRYISSTLFIAFGLIFLTGALLGLEIL
ncbi:UPF0016 domain-containing protein [Candidatus Bathyarchaeota archaeon]|nr:MAG: UPF0016 domain-containing protein [Candidatus Bathyarchaeota archaeon]